MQKSLKIYVFYFNSMLIQEYFATGEVKQKHDLGRNLHISYYNRQTIYNHNTCCHRTIREKIYIYYISWINLSTV